MLKRSRPSSIQPFNRKNEDLRRIGQLLNVETVLEGSVRKSGNKLRVTAQLIKVRDGFHLWSERHDSEMKDGFDIQDDITRAIVGALEVHLGGGAETQFVRRQTASTEAYELYVKGRVFWNERGAGLIKALHYFELALLEDANCAPAWSGRADAYAGSFSLHRKPLVFRPFHPCSIPHPGEKSRLFDPIRSAVPIFRGIHECGGAVIKEAPRTLRIRDGQRTAADDQTACISSTKAVRVCQYNVNEFPAGPAAFQGELSIDNSFGRARTNR